MYIKKKKIRKDIVTVRMKYFYVYNIDEIKPPKKSLDDEDAPKWPFYIVVSGRSNTGKTNMLLNLFLGDKYYDMKEGKKKIGERPIRCNDIVLVGHYINEPKYRLIRNFYKKIADPSKPYYEDVTFTAFTPDKIPDLKQYKNSKRRTVFIFEDVCTESPAIQNRIIPFFTRGRHSNISAIYNTHKFTLLSKIIRENSSHLVIFDGGGSTEDIARIIRQYIEKDPRKASRVINNYLRNREFIVFDKTVPISDPMSIRLGWMNPLDLEKEIKLLTA